MYNQNINYTELQKNFKLNMNGSGNKLKTAAKIFLTLGILTGVILGIVMFSKAGESKDSFLVGDTASGFFTWLGFGFLLGLPALSIVHYFLLNGLGEAIELIQQQNSIISSQVIHSQNKEPDIHESKALVLSNEYGMYCGYCNNYVNAGDYHCSRCHSVLVFDTEHTERKEEPQFKQSQPEANYHHQVSTQQYMGNLHPLNRNESQNHSTGNQPLNKKDDISDLIERIDQYYQSEPTSNNSRFCQCCGSKLKSDSSFCPICGAKAE